MTDESDDRKKKMRSLRARRLRGHQAAATCCIPSRLTPTLVATAGEDGRVCFFDLRCKDVQLVIELGNDHPVSSLCYNQDNESVIYVSAGAQVKCFDVHKATSWKPLETYSHNKDEINQVVCNSRSSYIAAADDNGDIKIIDIREHCPYKTLRTVISGGLDSKLVMWDFSRGRPYHALDFGINASRGGVPQCYNPAFVHAIAVPEIDMLDRVKKMCAVARGDGVISVVDIESEISCGKLKKMPEPRKGSRTRPKASLIDAGQETATMLHLDYSLGGHTAAASSVTFSLFGERGKLIVSGGNDQAVKVWDWRRYLEDAQISGETVVPFSVNLQKKVNWLCTTPSVSENLVVCDTSKVVYSRKVAWILDQSVVIIL
ncbi:WD repeat-containing protein [Drosera capensis]